jgi:hypothetical protein
MELSGHFTAGLAMAKWKISRCRELNPGGPTRSLNLYWQLSRFIEFHKEENF